MQTAHQSLRRAGNKGWTSQGEDWWAWENLEHNAAVVTCLKGFLGERGEKEKSYFGNIARSLEVHRV